jgi:hypothetical protein
MIVQEGGGYAILEAPADPQADMIRRQRDFQIALGLWDPRVSGRAPTFVLPGRCLHNLDCAVQEASEAWDMLEGGWKHHKRQPAACDRTELMLELVDVFAYLANAHLFMGGSIESELVAGDVLAAGARIMSLRADMDWAWSKHENKEFAKVTRALYDHGGRAHGEQWVKDVASWVNRLRAKIVAAGETLRFGLQQMSRAERAPEAFPANPAFIYLELFPLLYAAVASVPGASQQEFYSAFVHKAEINIGRLRGGY